MRSITTIKADVTAAQAEQLISQFLTANGFVYTLRKGEPIWKKGDGWVAAPRMFSVKYADGQIEIGSWIPFALLPGVFIGESGLSSSFGFAVKAAQRANLRNIINLFQAFNVQVTGYCPT